MKNTKKYALTNRESGLIIDTYITKEEAEKDLERNEQEDKKDGNYEDNYYQIATVDDRGDIIDFL